VDSHAEQLEASFPIGGTPLYAAASVASPGFWRLRQLGVDPDAVPAGGSGFTPARGAMDCVYAAWAQFSLADLCANGGDVNASQKNGSSVLHGAVLRRDATLVRLAIRKGADVSAKNSNHRTPYNLAVHLNWAEGATLLRAHKSLPRDNRSSRFALDANHEPIVRPDLSDVPKELQREVTLNSHFNLPRVRELVGKDKRLVFSISGDEELAIEACAHVGNTEIIKYYLDHGAPLSLPTAVSLGDLPSVAAWLESNPDLIRECGAHDFPLMWYVVMGGGSLEMAELLVNSGVPIDQESVGTTALHACIKRGQVDLMDWLLEHGANPEGVGCNASRDGDTSLDLAIASKEAKMVELLKAAGARR
jgi:ankyrin repeat protein